MLALEALPTGTSPTDARTSLKLRLRFTRLCWSTIKRRSSTTRRRGTCSFQPERRPHCHLVLRQDRTHLGRVEGTETAVLRGHKGPIERAEFSPDASRIVTAARDGTARIWNATSGEELFVLQPVGNFPTAIFSPNGNRVLTAGEYSPASLWDAQTGRKVLSVRSNGASRADFSPDGRSFVTANGRSDVSIWNAEDGARTGF